MIATFPVPARVFFYKHGRVAPLLLFANRVTATISMLLQYSARRGTLNVCVHACLLLKVASDRATS